MASVEAEEEREDDSQCHLALSWVSEAVNHFQLSSHAFTSRTGNYP